MRDIQKVIRELKQLCEDFENSLGSEEMIRLAECIEELSSISNEIREIGLALRIYTERINQPIDIKKLS
jgi:hypothetical protein